jgi:hypothetical protein
MIAGITASQARFQGAQGAQFVGGFVDNTTGAVLPFDFTSLTDVQVGDYIVVVAGWSRAGTTTVSLGTIPTGLSSLGSRIASDTIDTSIHIYGGFYEAGTASGGSVNNPGSNSTNMVGVYAFRGIDATTPQDTAVQLISRTNGCDITLLSITPVTPGAIIICAAVAGHQSNSNNYIDPAGFKNIYKVGNGNTYDGAIIIAQAQSAWSSGVFVPGLFDFAGGDTLSSAAGFTMALRPAA